jgi:SPP1 family phage portal protein
MYTYQDLLSAGADEEARAEFCKRAVEEFKGTQKYKDAREGEAYYHKHNITIENFQKFLYTTMGRKMPDIYSSNYKLKTLFFRRLVIQQVQYVLGNGVTFDNVSTKDRLSKPHYNFDFQVQEAAKRAMAGGTAFGFWNYDHLEVFGYADTPSEPGFCPLYSEIDAKLMAGIRFWYTRVGDTVVFKATLYEADGYTDYIQSGTEAAHVAQPKRAYKTHTTSTPFGGVESEVGENYSTLPIVPLYANDSHESELVGIRESIDCYDLIKSGLANNIDDSSGFYWLIKNSGGMDDIDLAKLVQRMKTVRAAALDSDDGGELQALTQEVSYEAREKMLEILRNDIYDDFQALDVKAFSSGAKTAQEIKSAYQPQDNKCADFEYYILDFIQNILEIAEINDNPVLNWNKIINQSETTSMVLMAASYLTDEMVIKKLPFLTPEEADEVIKARATSALDRFSDDESSEMSDEADRFEDEGGEG